MRRILLLATLAWTGWSASLSLVASLVETCAAEPTVASAAEPWLLPDPRDVQLGGVTGDAYRRGIDRLSQDPYGSPAFLRSDISFEMQRVFTNYSGDISGRFIQIASLTSPRGQMSPAALSELLQGITRFQNADGHFGAAVDWNAPLEPESPRAVMLPIFWGNSRLLVGLLEAHRAFGRPELLEAARRIGDFYIVTADRFLDPAREAEYRATGSYAAGYPTDYFPGIEGLALLYIATQDPRYLQQAERMAEFFRRFDQLPIDHSHGNLITHYGLLLLYDITGKSEYLDRPLQQWKNAVEGGYVWPLGGVAEKFQVNYIRDEGCSEADWLRLNLALWRVTGQTRFLDMAERLLWNHYAMNRTANGGYGHHDFACDAVGPLLMQANFTEAVWCCTFHGLLGLQTLKSYVAAGSPRGLFINFPLDFTAPVAVRGNTWNVTVAREDSDNRSWTCRLQLGSPGTTADLPDVFLRRPAWAEEVVVRDAAGQACPWDESDSGYVRLPVRPGDEGVVRVTFSWSPHVENRRLQQLDIRPDVIGRHAEVVLRDGPYILLANSPQPRPVIVGIVDQQGHLMLPESRDGMHRLLQVDRLDATEVELATAARSGVRCGLADWTHIRQDAAAAFVFDLITLPADSDLARLVTDAPAR